ncbi:hypothetical protein CC78DRAFT_615471 [Lojkania enalia]|uniref:Acyltransferase 3 domain-containing protein n=1 Tax=Lojkania enalia TaxID=147567 RepID=A0A9P4N783_9PLEO|nr:hypothetical protein CC78DRAFT_615471 [Didymosphaeria enalia]
MPLAKPSNSRQRSKPPQSSQPSEASKLPQPSQLSNPSKRPQLSQAPKLPRSHALDNLRTSLTILVIVHHVSLPYGGFGTWDYTPSSNRTPPLSSLPLLTFNTLNQTFFMATFFLLSGYFSALTATKRMRRAWVQEKWRRLGVPSVVHSVFGVGIVRGIVVCVRDGGSVREVVGACWDGVKSVRGARGAMWYPVLLFIFDIIYALLSPSTFHTAHSEAKKKLTTMQTPRSKNGLRIQTYKVLLALLCTSLSAFLVRINYPIGRHFRPLSLYPGYLPQYILFYTTGILSYTHPTPLQSLLSPHTKLSLLVLVLIITTFGLKILITDLHHMPLSTIVAYTCGGWNVYALLYAFWNEVLGALLSSLCLDVFTRWAGGEWVVGRFHVARYSYAAFLVHTPVVVLMQCAVDGWTGGGLVKTGVVGGFAVPVCWGVGWVVVRAIEGMGSRGYI